ncbi:MAG: hypothetical protein V5B35_09640 [Candidatus Accumulibacter necessarius]
MQAPQHGVNAAGEDEASVGGDLFGAYCCIRDVIDDATMTAPVDQEAKPKMMLRALSARLSPANLINYNLCD